MQCMFGMQVMCNWIVYRDKEERSLCIRRFVIVYMYHHHSCYEFKKDKRTAYYKPVIIIIMV